jgi:hypothetical protein
MIDLRGDGRDTSMGSLLPGDVGHTNGRRDLLRPERQMGKSKKQSSTPL